ncbi:MAG: GxxExxY protein [Patescibacteria group bacterium]
MQISKLIYPAISYKINGILFSVHNDLGRFCNEKQYGDALENYLKNNKIDYSRELVLPPSFENELKGRNKVDFIIQDKVLVELKAKRMIERSDYYQTKRYLKALNKKLGIIVNFRDKYIKPRRVINSDVSE